MVEDFKIPRVSKSSGGIEQVDLKQLGVFNYDFKRRVLPQNLREDMRSELGLHSVNSDLGFVLNPIWFDDLTPVNHRIALWNYTVDSCESYPIAIKDTEGVGWEGLSFPLIRSNLVNHHKASRKGVIDTSRYELHLPACYGDLYNRYLLMEFIDGYNHSYFSSLLSAKARNDALFKPVEESFLTADEEFRKNFSILKQKNLIQPGLINQRRQSIVAGHTSPGDLENGKWVFFLPYDLR